MGRFPATAQPRLSTDLARPMRVHRCRSAKTIISLRRHRISRICAVWLVTLILLPFTAPFKTYDLGNSASDHPLEWLLKDNTDSDDKLAPPSDWFLIRPALNIVSPAPSDLLSWIEEHKSQYILLRL
jgi:hypothetical protein